jgi:hypothetical protein
MSASGNFVLSSRRHCPLTVLPAELSIKILSSIDLEIEALTKLCLVDQLFYNFMKSHEAILVINAVKHRDPLAALLVLRPNPSYHALFTLYNEQKILHSIIDIVQREEKYRHCFPHIKDPNFWQSPGCAHVLRAGFLIHHRIASIETRQDKAMYVDELPQETWALASVFEQFLSSVLVLLGRKVFPEIERACVWKSASILFFIQELAIFSSLKVVRDFIELRHQPLKIQKTTDLYEWARAFESRYLANGDTVLFIDSKMRKQRLKLFSCLSLIIMRGTQACISPGANETGCVSDCLHDDILGSILPRVRDGSAVFKILERLPVNKTRCRVTTIEETTFTFPMSGG